MGEESDIAKVDPERLSTQLGTIVREIHSALKTISALSGPLVSAQAAPFREPLSLFRRSPS